MSIDDIIRALESLTIGLIVGILEVQLLAPEKPRSGKQAKIRLVKDKKG
jgi:hypothetical protein